LVYETIQIGWRSEFSREAAPVTAVAAYVQNRALELGGAVTARLDQRIRADMPTLLVPIPEPRL